MNRTEENCPQCPNHCDRDSLMCGRGRTYFGDRLSFDEKFSYESVTHDRHEADDVVLLLRQLGHSLHHNPREVTEDEICANLTQDEKSELKELLKKIST